jgi:hypothetical protein
VEFFSIDAMSAATTKKLKGMEILPPLTGDEEEKFRVAFDQNF